MIPEWPDWLILIRQIGVLLIWLMFPLQIYQLHWTFRQIHRWQQAEDERVARWRADLITVDKLREEAYHLRAQAEVALAQARRPLHPEIDLSKID